MISPPLPLPPSPLDMLWGVAIYHNFWIISFWYLNQFYLYLFLSEAWSFPLHTEVLKFILLLFDCSIPVWEEKTVWDNSSVHTAKKKKKRRYFVDRPEAKKSTCAGHEYIISLPSLMAYRVYVVHACTCVFTRSHGAHGSNTVHGPESTESTSVQAYFADWDNGAVMKACNAHLASNPQRLRRRVCEQFIRERCLTEAYQAQAAVQTAVTAASDDSSSFAATNLSCSGVCVPLTAKNPYWPESTQE